MYTTLATYEYPEALTYSGPSHRAEINFRALKGTKLLVNWLLEDLIVYKAKMSDVTPLRAVLKHKEVNTGYLDYITDDYQLILYFHDSPAVASIILAISTALVAAGFLVLAWNSTPDTWKSISKIPLAISEIPKQTSKVVLYAGIALAGLFYLQTKNKGTSYVSN